MIFGFVNVNVNVNVAAGGVLFWKFAPEVSRAVGAAGLTQWGAGQRSMLRRCVALGTDWLWLHHTPGSSSECVDPPTLGTLRDREAGRQVPELLPAADPSSRRVHPMGVATVTVFCIFFWDWPEPLCSVQLMSEAQARLETCSSGGGRLIGIEEQQQQQRRHGALQQTRSSGAGAAEEARRWCQSWLEKHKGSSLEKVTYAYYLQHFLLYSHLRLKVYVIYI